MNSWKHRKLRNAIACSSSSRQPPSEWLQSHAQHRLGHTPWHHRLMPLPRPQSRALASALCPGSDTTGGDALTSCPPPAAAPAVPSVRHGLQHLRQRLLQLRRPLCHQGRLHGPHPRFDHRQERCAPPHPTARLKPAHSDRRSPASEKESVATRFGSNPILNAFIAGAGLQLPGRPLRQVCSPPPQTPNPRPQAQIPYRGPQTLAPRSAPHP